MFVLNIRQVLYYHEKTLYFIGGATYAVSENLEKKILEELKNNKKIIEKNKYYINIDNILYMNMQTGEVYFIGNILIQL